jgi:hypothetical protein
VCSPPALGLVGGPGVDAGQLREIAHELHGRRNALYGAFGEAAHDQSLEADRDGHPELQRGRQGRTVKVVLADLADITAWKDGYSRQQEIADRSERIDVRARIDRPSGGSSAIGGRRGEGGWQIISLSAFDAERQWRLFSLFSFSSPEKPVAKIDWEKMNFAARKKYMKSNVLPEMN